GLNVMLFDDFYPEGHQGGVTIIQYGVRVAANGDLRLEQAPGQWSPVPLIGKKSIDTEKGIITVKLSYPDSNKNRKGFNPIDYPQLNFDYTISAEAVGSSIKLTVDLGKPLPAEWMGKVGFNLELFPGTYFSEHYLMDGRSGIFPLMFNSPVISDRDGLSITPLAAGKELIISEENPEKRIKISSTKNVLELIDGRAFYNNGWFILRSVIPAGAAANAVEWIISPDVIPDWKYKPVVQVSQVGYHPAQSKFAVIELDKNTVEFESIMLVKISRDSLTVVKEIKNPIEWGNFLRYKYLRFDFSSIAEEGIYKIRYGDIESDEFEIKKDIFSRHVWQPTLEYFLPVQMCHMRIEDRYKVWHGLCHMDDALMAPVNHNHFDGYYQQGSTLTKFQSGVHVPGLNAGGWHDAGDYDLRIESQAETVYKLSLAYEFFKNDYDQTTINEQKRIVELHKPDGIPDILQQIEHGLFTIIGAYESMGRLYRGIICPTLKQYVHLGDAATMSDNLIYKENEKDPILNTQLPEDDRWVFTEKNPRRELYTAQVLALAAKVMKEYNPDLARKCLAVSEEIFLKDSSNFLKNKINAAAELYLTASNKEYENVILENADSISENIGFFSEVIGRVTEKLNNEEFTKKFESGVKKYFQKAVEEQKQNPYGVPYKPYIWGAGWGIQDFGVTQLFLHLGFPEICSTEYAFNAMNFVLGCHPGENTASFVSGVGVNSLTVAYGVNRDEWSYIPGGAASGTSLIRPDLPELKVWPYLWQQSEYIIGGGALDYMLL
ncbi:MAG TPA: glycoside hydrolase family 9 protein, partial [Ignavibacteriaceae bacterium]|nr:glycoside hydrolase family 9 protein [Ignavibacteriaceae bacterium]